MTPTPQTQPQVCARCAADNPAGNRFCGQCGQALMPAAATTGERRPLTVVFCDLVASATLSARLDAEDLSGLLADYHRVCSAAVERHDGHIAQYLGDGVLIYFGYPRAHEDDALRAVRCGLDILHGLAALNAQAGRIAPLQARLAAHSGRVFVNSVGRGATSETLAVGEVPNVAARVQSGAQVGTMLVTQGTWALVDGYVHAHPLGAQSFKGIDGAIGLWQVVSDAGSRSRLEASSDRTPFVGRGRELAMLDAAWQRAQAGHAVCVLLRADPGQGKSRLAEIFGARISSPCLEVRCTPYSQTSPLRAVVDMVARALDAADPALGPQERCRRLIEGLSRCDVADPLDQGVIASTLGLEGPQFAPSLVLPPPEQRRRLMDALTRFAVFSRNAEPAVLLLEDLHWADASTLALVGGLALQPPAGARLMLLTARPEWAPDWLVRAAVRVIDLNELDDDSVAAMIRHLASGQQIPPDVVREITARSDGVPLFVEEITRAALSAKPVQAGRAPLPGAQRTLSAAVVPVSIEAALVARLDSLGDARRTLQVASVLGREFDVDQLVAVCGQPDERVSQDINRAQTAGLVRMTSAPRGFEFKHALIRDAALESLPRRDRSTTHARVARALLEQFPQTALQRPELIAQHFTEAGDLAEAVPQWLSAGVLALRRSANQEATLHLERALDLLQHLAPGEERDRQEIAILYPLGSSLRASAGLVASNTLRVYERLKVLSRTYGHSDSKSRHGEVLGLWGGYFGRCMHEEGLAHALKSLAVAQALGDDFVTGLCLRLAGDSCWAMGRFSEAHVHLERAIPLTMGEGDAARPLLAQDDGVAVQVFLGYNWACLGSSGNAITAVESGITRAHSLAHATSIGLAYLGAAWTALILHDVPGAVRYGRPAVDACERSGFQNYADWARFVLAWARSQEGEPVAGLADMISAAASARATGTRVFRSQMLCFIGEALIDQHDLARARSSLEEAEAIVRDTSERYYEAEIHRVMGRLAWAEGDRPGAVAQWSMAERVADLQHAELYRLRLARADDGSSIRTMRAFGDPC